MLFRSIRPRQARSVSVRIDLVFSVKTRADIIFEKELAALAQRFPDLHVTVTLTREPKESDWSGERGPITRELLQRVAPNLRGTPVYLCGPDPMMAAMKAVLREIMDPSAVVHVEAFVSPPPASASEDNVAAEEADESPARSDGGSMVVQFATSGASTSVEEGQTLLDAAEDLGIDIPFDCRAGICGQCKTKLVKGRVVMDVQDALTPEDGRRRLVLACQARPVRDVVVDA